MKGKILATLMILSVSFVVVLCLLSAALAAIAFVVWEPWFTYTTWLWAVRISAVAAFVLLIAMIVDEDGYTFDKMSRDLQ